MNTAISNVTTSDTFRMYNTLTEKGYKATLTAMFSYGYNQDNKYLSILIGNLSDIRLSQLFDDAKNFEIVLVKLSKSGLMNFEIRKTHDFSEFVTDNVWDDYYKSTGAFDINIK